MGCVDMIRHFNEVVEGRLPVLYIMYNVSGRSQKCAVPFYVWSYLL